AIGFEILFPVGGSIPYIFQYSEIHHRRNAQGFSLFVCLALCIANILRILFWFGKRFDLALLAQSVVMFICMILMLEIAVRMNKKHTPKSQQKSLLSGLFLLEKSIIIAEIMD
ncbi:PQ loop repeat protein, partial [Ostertagia ostertagi]